jgi:nucleotide-binding universal stress UspA family protein
MYRHLLVPLDGSRLAECALPAAALCARTLGAELTLVHVIERKAPSVTHGDRHLTTVAEASSYLAQTAGGPLLAGLRVTTHVHEAEVRDVARSITEHTAEFAPDLIVMSTHGRGGARRLIVGSIAQQIIAQGDTPVLLVRVAPGRPPAAPAAAFLTVLAPIDGDPDHERGLPAAAELARAHRGRLHLLMVVPTVGRLAGERGAAGRLMPGAARLMLEMDHEAASAYLEAHARALAGEGLTVTWEASRGDPARAIVAAARRQAADLVVMGTHGRAGAEAFWTGSVASRVIARLEAPLLLVPLTQASR